ncbi:hypothetical protein RMSM_06150 [Rhodopirellula maiorica SM1]|uniref:Uncharacterized protein n=1 Tax=Rhodopirellula maiorica SM1 TaxID=1265738 RepID=M5RSH9_9BACT|nr:hypothetical protein RMSM_06150 [Rhodopirellula maiorica SM1]
MRSSTTSYFLNYQNATDLSLIQIGPACFPPSTCQNAFGSSETDWDIEGSITK